MSIGTFSSVTDALVVCMQATFVKLLITICLRVLMSERVRVRAYCNGVLATCDRTCTVVTDQRVTSVTVASGQRVCDSPPASTGSSSAVKRPVCQRRALEVSYKIALYKSAVIIIPRCMECQRAMRKVSVCLSICQAHGLWQYGSKICPDFHTIRKIIEPAFLRRMVGGRGGDPFYLKFSVNRPPLERWNRRFRTDIRS